MQIIERGSGAPIVFVPGLQGRWEYARPAVEALAADFRVITFSLDDDPARGFDGYGDQIAAAMDTAGVRRAAVCGLSFGGLGALNFAVRFPDRVSALVLVSTPGPGFRLRPRHEMYARVPWLFGALFALEVPFRAHPELRAALPDAAERRRFSRWLLRTAVSAPVSLSRMAARARRIASFDGAAVCEAITAPTLIVTGEPALDFVVDADGTSQYARLIAGAAAVVLPRTGHQGTITRPRAFADIVRRFIVEGRHAAA
jgi:pimeloyl-ACP methyl ester carboxylesterase